MIYFIEAVGVGHIKIGFTDSLDASDRLTTLQTGSPVPLRLLGTIPGTLDDEKDLHRRFASARGVGEWFRPVAELLALIVPKQTLICGPVEVIEQSVQIRVLTVGRKQFTKSLFAQLPERHIVDWHASSPEKFVEAESKPWGWVKIGDESHVIWEDRGVLYRFHAPDRPPIHLTKEGNYFSPVFRKFWNGLDLDRAEELRKKYSLQWDQRRMHWFMNFDQLFIGV